MPDHADRKERRTGLRRVLTVVVARACVRHVQGMVAQFEHPRNCAIIRKGHANEVAGIGMAASAG